MEKKHIIRLAVLLVIVIGLAIFATHEYEIRKIAKPSLSYSQLQTANKTLQSELTAMQSVNAVDKANLGQNQNAINTLTTQKTSICAAIAAHHLVSAACQ